MTEAGTQTPEITTPVYLQDYSKIADEIQAFIENPDPLPARRSDFQEFVRKVQHDWEIIVKLREELEEKGLTFARVNGYSQISFLEHDTLLPHTIETTTFHHPLPLTQFDVQIDFESYGHANSTNLRSVRISAPMPAPNSETNKTIERVASFMISADGTQARLSCSLTESQERLVQGLPFNTATDQ